jgi:glycosyltransferase involved in cell wall biosynthesis
MALRPFCGRYRIIMDAHNEAVAPFAHPYWPIPQLARLALRWADLTIVTNAALAEQVKKAGGRPHVLPDRLPTAPLQPSPLPLSAPIEVMVVATYAADEPIAEIIEAAKLVGPEYRLHITGRKDKLPREQRERLPANVIQTDFLPEQAYWHLMASCHFVLDLTLKPNCLVCGAYEALALAKPMILTGNPATVDLFGPVAVFPADSTARDIAQALRESAARYAELGHKALQHKLSFAQRWTERAGDLALTISRWSTQPASQ